MSPQQAASVLLDRRNARRSLEHFASRVPVPGSPMDEADEDARIPLIETQQARHHRLILSEMQCCMETPHGRLMIFAPPGSAKSTYASVVAPCWWLGTHPDSRIILASYGDDLARKHGRRTRQLISQPETAAILQCSLQADSRAADAFGLTNGSEYIACGIMSGVTGNRAHHLIIDDPIKGREQADSQVIRDRTFEAYEDDLLTRLLPGGSVVMILTRWQEDDPAGRILPENWAGESGDILCRDGNVWRVLCLQAECQNSTDPLGRKTGEMLWPEWFTDRHWAQFRINRRTWSSLYQQVPAPAEGILFRKDDMLTYDRLPDDLRIIGGYDTATLDDDGDWTEIGVAGVSQDGDIFLIDWWRGQVNPEIWIEKLIDMIVEHRPLMWMGEVGVIRRSTEWAIKRRMNERHANCRFEWLPHIGDKTAKAQSVIASAGSGRLYWPRKSWVGELQRQCLVFPAGSPDDGVDALAMIGRGADKLGRRRPNTNNRKTQVHQPARGTGAWMAA